MSVFNKLRRSVRNAIGWTLQKLRFPAVIREFEYVDPVTDQTTYLTTTKNYSILTAGDRQFYFDRVTGKFDGTGSASQLRIARRIELRD
jgi:hypothetical protein